MKKLVFLFVLLLSQQVNSFELLSGVIAKGADTVRTEDQAKASVAMTDIIKSANAYHGRSYGYTNMGGGDVWFRLYSNLSISSVKLTSKTYLGNWPLSRWEGETSNNQFNQFTVLNSDDYPANALRQKIWSSHKGLGCYNETPLRYGDIEGDGEKEIVLLVGEVNHNLDMLVFSPSQGKSVFGVRLAVHDSQENVYGEYSKYDYISTLDLRSAYQASRLYAKVFAGDFNQQDTGTYDLLVWRKAYWANLKTQTPKGFSLKASLLSHFALIDGEYVLQDTDQATIQTWLSENELTWSKGFPSVSECEGEEGKLIPEMHDPLLNDPDVLQ